MKINPNTTFWLSFIALIAQGIATGTVHLSGLIPAEMIPSVTGWMGFAVFVWMCFQTAMNGFSGPGVGPLASKPTVEEANKIMDQAKGAGK